MEDNQAHTRGCMPSRDLPNPTQTLGPTTELGLMEQAIPEDTLPLTPRPAAPTHRQRDSRQADQDISLQQLQSQVASLQKQVGDLSQQMQNQLLHLSRQMQNIMDHLERSSRRSQPGASAASRLTAPIPIEDETLLPVDSTVTYEREARVVDEANVERQGNSAATADGELDGAVRGDHNDNDSSSIPVPLEAPPNGGNFPSLEAAVEFLDEWAAARGYGVRRETRKLAPDNSGIKRIYWSLYGCDHAATRHNHKENPTRHSARRDQGCKARYSLSRGKNDEHGTWTIRTLEARHNGHGPSDSHPSRRRRMRHIVKQLIHDELQAGSTIAVTMNRIKADFGHNFPITESDIHNERVLYNRMNRQRE